jgi:hypothetical protein
MNEVIAGVSKARTVRRRDGSVARISEFTETKRAQTERVATFALRDRVVPMQAAYVTFYHRRSDRRVDPDNFCAGARKVILDGLQVHKLLPNDGWSQVLGFADWWDVDARKPGILVILDPERTWTKSECETLLQERERGGRQRERVG